MIHAQLPLRVPCYDLALIIDPTLTQHFVNNDIANKVLGFRYYRLRWLDGRLSSLKQRIDVPKPTLFIFYRGRLPDFTSGPHGRISRMRRAQCICCFNRYNFSNNFCI